MTGLLFASCSEARPPQRDFERVGLLAVARLAARAQPQAAWLCLATDREVVCLCPLILVW